ncbi:ABC-F family ATP-binding cassette domain-containing protein [Alteribacillus sp. HJP-4]|uniref:ABC-F family ATP-binding cassette domain-containing protein n=1 Tax=Alteribacillus sp. HJP-4 TaxID=2775394 RepID=UPI0035CCF801
MIVLQCVNVSKSYGAETILRDVKMEIKEKERVALVGRNGAGKSTLLKIISGQLGYDTGDVIIPKETKLGYLDQHSGLQSDRSIWEEMLTVFSSLRKMEKKLRTLEEKMAAVSVNTDPDSFERVSKEYDELQHAFRSGGGYQYEADIRGVLSGLSFSGFDYNESISSLSGGQKTRLALGKLLLSKPDVLVLDEPTNHLDIDTLRWLEQYLSSYPGAVLIVSHDRYFLDNIVTKVYEVAWQKAALYHGNYSRYLVEKANRFEQELKAFEKQQKERAVLEDFVQRNIARASTSKRAQSRRKKLENMDQLDRPDGALKSAKFSFEIDRQSGNDVLQLQNISISYGSHPPIIEQLTLSIKRGESIGLIGPNGAGKSTLLKAIAGSLNIDSGSIRLGSKISVGYYDQEQAGLDSRKDVLHELWDDYPLTPEKEIRTVLGNFLFSGEDVLKQVYDLSGGEKARLALAKLMMQKANFLIFDEPTNHLDLDSKEVLESALLDYPGTLLFVSHDRYFLNRMATKIVELNHNGLQEYLGDYDYFLMKKEEAREREALRAHQQPQKDSSEQTAGADSDKEKHFQGKEAKKLARKRQRDIENTEADIAELEEQLAQYEADMLTPEVYEDHEKAALVQQEIDSLQVRLESLMETWEALQTEEV